MEERHRPPQWEIKFNRVQREVWKRKKSDGNHKVINETLSQDYV